MKIMQQANFDFTADNNLSGFRLHRFEMLNWGTFHQKIWSISPLGKTSLLTGDIGSGKSTVIDALVSLLVPPKKILFNKAAGAESKERSLASYVLGAYKSEKDAESFRSKQITLRNDKNYSVLLAYFYNEGMAREITLAQVFRIKGATQIERFYIVGQMSMTIKEDFSNIFDLAGLKKRFKKHKNIELFDSFKSYSSRFCQLFGIQNIKALDLFFQTVSMKSVGNLTDFVRQHMLDKGNIEEKINNLCKNFDDLNRLHEAVLKAKSQIKALGPIEENGDKYNKANQELAQGRTCRDLLDPYFSSFRINLNQKRLENLELEKNKLVVSLNTHENSLKDQREKEIQTRQGIEQNGGGRIEFFESQIRQLAKERTRKQKLFQEYQKGAEAISLTIPGGGDEFVENQQFLETKQEKLLAKKKMTEKGILEKGIKIRKLHDQEKDIKSEIESLKSRKSNIPYKSLRLRAQLSENLGLQEDEIPFVGELIKVKDDSLKWEGAIEKLLHNFAQGILVPDKYYEQVSNFVDKTHLKGRLVYFRVKQKDRNTFDVDPQSIFHKVSIKFDTIFFDWIEAEIKKRFDFNCCDSLDDFRRNTKAITLNGQIKSSGVKHEKDDRYSLADRSRYVLGWTNKEKILALAYNLKELQTHGQKLINELKIIEKTKEQNELNWQICHDLLKIDSFEEIDWASCVAKIQEYKREIQAIEKSSTLLSDLKRVLAKTIEQIKNYECKIKEITEKKGSVLTKIEQIQIENQNAQEDLDQVEKKVQEHYFPLLKELLHQLKFIDGLNLHNLEKRKRDSREKLKEKINNLGRQVKVASEKTIRLMSDFCHAYPEETVDMDAAMESLHDFTQFLDKLKQEDLPRHQQRFKEKLNQDTVNGIAMFQNYLEQQKREIEDKITSINKSLLQIDYNDSSYIKLILEKSYDHEIKEFQASLKQCLSYSLDEFDLYSEAKFLQVKEIIDRFNGRVDLAEMDRRWTKKVTDVRNWFSFAASERWREDDVEKEFYSDSSGKSGGQKEKLAYTILASALAYQFGLEWGEVRTQSFRFVAIDEAFGRGSDESTRFGLELFKKLDLQLLVVTPLQKINVIEDYVHGVHFVHNIEGKNSQIRNLKIKEFRQEKKDYQMKDDYSVSDKEENINEPIRPTEKEGQKLLF
ncbi:MAG: ATP-dependent exonuclease SbcCD, C subunit-like protein [Bacteriovoracaceae bacterium]|nr:ATP-dependent exonuclease SbcCD, C subunit-like protein [Bacteriovoracaceae bacterium]